MHPNLEITSDDSKGSFFHVRADKEGIGADTTFLSCPNPLSISYLNAINFPPFSSDGPTLPDSLVQSLPVHTVTVFFMIQQYLKREKSFWWPYFNSLPPPEEGEKLGTPLWFTEEDRKWFRGTNLENGIQGREKEWKHQWKEGVRLLEEAGWETDGYTW